MESVMATRLLPEVEARAKNAKTRRLIGESNPRCCPRLVTSRKGNARWQGGAGLSSGGDSSASRRRE